MINWQKVLVIELVVCIALLPCGDFGALAGQTPPEPAQVKKQVGLFGVGASVKVKLTNKKKVQGTISEITEDAFEVSSAGRGGPTRVTYDQVAQLKLTSPRYPASNQPNAVEARRVVAGLGVGKHVMVKLADKKKLRGNIQAIEQEQFALLADGQKQTVQIAYSDVRDVHPAMKRGNEIALIVGVAGGAALAILIPVMALLSID